MFFWVNFFLRQESWENLGKFSVLNVNSTKFPIFWINFTNNLIPKKEKKDYERLQFALKINFQINVH
jgi:hypothetical protein